MGTIMVLGFLLLIVGSIIFSLVKKQLKARKTGTCSCNCSCGCSCSHATQCCSNK